MEDRFASDGKQGGLGPGSDERFGELGQFGAVRVQGFEEVDGPCVGDHVDPGFRDGDSALSVGLDGVVVGFEDVRVDIGAHVP